MSRAFAAFWAGQAVSMAGDALGRVALPLLVLDTTGSVTSMGLATAVAAVGTILGGALAGGVLDRFDRLRVLLACDALQAATYAALPLCAWAYGRSFVTLLVVSFLGALLGSVFRVGSTTFIAELVTPAELARANGRMVAGFGLGNFAGPVAMAAVSPSLGVEPTLGLNAITFVVSALTLVLARRLARGVRVSRAARAVAAGGAAFAHIARVPALRLALIVTTGEMLLLGGGLDLFIVRVRDELGRGEAAVGTIFAFASLGAIAGGLGSAALARRLGLGWTLLGALVAEGACVATLGIAATLPMVAASATGYACAASILGVCALTIRQERSAPELLGRVNATFFTAHFSALPLGALVATGFAEGHGAGHVLAVLGGLTVPGAMLALGRARSRRSLDRLVP